MTETELKPCPFCGNKEIIDDEDDGITCPKCGAYIDRLSVEDDRLLSDVWNTRPIEDAKDEEIKRIQKASEEIKKMVKDTQDAVYIFPVDLDSEYKEHILEALEEALEGRKE